ncbi:MAG: hypothetical protein H0U91_10745 [Rubrobacter sp.]|nr:hypothetical protein [Rubrobacter sp.]
MGFRESALTRLRRYRGEADRSLGLAREVEDVTRRFSGRLFGGLEHAAVLGREAGFEIEASHTGGLFVLGVVLAPGMEARVGFGVVGGAAAEADEDLMHEELSRYSLDPSGYSGRVLGWSRAVGEDPCQTFSVYRDGIWKTKGVFVVRARGRVDDPDDVLNGFCLRILGRLIDLAATTGGVGRRWSDAHGYDLARYLGGEDAPTELRLPG